MTTKQNPLDMATAALELGLHQLATSPHKEDWAVANELREAIAAIRSAPTDTLADDVRLSDYCAQAIRREDGRHDKGAASVADIVLRAIDAYRREKRARREGKISGLLKALELLPGEATAIEALISEAEGK